MEDHQPLTTPSDHHSPKKTRFSHQKPSTSCPNTNTTLFFSSKPSRTTVSLPGDCGAGDYDRSKEIHGGGCSGRERLKRHREEVAGRVLVPEKWGMEELMKDWIDYSSFDKLLAPTGLRSAREALVIDSGRRRNGAASAAAQPSSPTATSPLLRIQNRCY